MVVLKWIKKELISRVDGRNKIPTEIHRDSQSSNGQEIRQVNRLLLCWTIDGNKCLDQY